MIRLTIIFLCLMMSATMAVAQLDVDTLTDAELVHLIQQVKRIPASRLDAALPPITFAKWLQIESGPGAQIAWALRYSNATSTDERESFPTCVETDARMEDGRSIIIFIGIGTQGKVRNIKPFVFRVDLWQPDESMRDESISLDRLSDLPAALRKVHETENPPEVQK
jgi:hypothetical protein